MSVCLTRWRPRDAILNQGNPRPVLDFFRWICSPVARKRIDAGSLFCHFFPQAISQTTLARCMIDLRPGGPRSREGSDDARVTTLISAVLDGWREGSRGIGDGGLGWCRWTGKTCFSFPDGLNKPDGLGVDNRHPAGLATGIRHLLGHVLIHMLDSRRLRPCLSAYVFELISFPLTQQPVVS